MQDTGTTFRSLCADHGIAVTHQRQVLYETMQSMHGHPSPEEVYAVVKQRILSMHHGTLRVEMNSHPHHHLVCSICKRIQDCAPEELGLPAHAERLPNGFAVERLSVDVIGLCAECQLRPN